MSTICSSTLGPASEPSLVIWPTRMTLLPVSLTYRSRLTALSLTCVTEPGNASPWSEEMACMESITIRSGLMASACSYIRSSDVSQSMNRESGIVSEELGVRSVELGVLSEELGVRSVELLVRRRSALILICCSLSLPLT